MTQTLIIHYYTHVYTVYVYAKFLSICVYNIYIYYIGQSSIMDIKLIPAVIFSSNDAY